MAIINIIRVAETDSTSREIVRRRSPGSPLIPLKGEDIKGEDGKIEVLLADYQTAGRGQQGSSWESERGKNLLFSVMVWPQGVEVRRQFRLSQAMAVAVRDALAEISQRSPLIPLRGEDIKGEDTFTIKWPNDIYYGERKVCGTIIETTWKGEMVERCVTGVGINVNQRVFRSDAPNPISLCQIVGCEVNRDELLDKVLERFASLYERLKAIDDEISRAYMSHLFWGQGMHRYCDADGEFEAEVVGVGADGMLTLRDTEGRERKYYFKDLKFEI